MFNYIVIFLLTHICLYAHGMNQNFTHKHDYELDQAIEKNDLNAVKKALDAGAVNLENALYKAMRRAQERLDFSLDIVEFLSDQPSINIDAQDEHKRTPLFRAVYTAAVPAHGDSIVNDKVREKFIVIIEILLKNGADPEVTQYNKTNAFDIAKKYDSILLKILIEGRAQYLTKRKKEIAESTGFNSGICGLISDYDVGPQTLPQEQTEQKADGAAGVDPSTGSGLKASS